MIYKLNSAVTLIELIVVITIVALLVIIGYPSYQTYLVESRRNDGINALRENQLIIENYLYENNITPTSGDVTLATTSKDGYYDISYTRIDDNSYKLDATAVSTKSQNNDTGCTVLTLINQMDDIYPPHCH